VKILIKSTAFLLLAAAIFSTFCACGGESMPEYYEKSYDTGTDMLSLHLAYDTMEKDADGKKIYFSDSELEKIFAQCCEIYNEAIQIVDHTDASTNLYEINQPVNAVFDMDPEVTALLERTFTISENCDGYYQPVYGTVTRLLQENAQPDAASLKDALAHTGTDKLRIENTSVYKTDSMSQVDLSSIKNGYALEKMIAYLEESSVVYGFVTLGDSAGVFGTKPDAAPYDIGVLSDTKAESVDGYVHVQDGYVFVASASLGGYLDYLTGSAAKSDLKKVVVRSEDAVTANALACALYAMGYEASQRLYDTGTLSFEAVFFLDDGTIELTKGAYRTGMYVPVAEDKEEK
jgi:thiamine biosynthesis lipoprotein ApbE